MISIKITINTIKYIFNAYAALGLYIFSSKKKIWLIGGHAGMLYTDNAKVFYEYILEKHPNIDIYWVVDKESPIKDKIKGAKIIKGSIKGYYYFYRSQVTLFSDTLNSDIAPYSFILPVVRRLYRRQFKVYLSHGTISFKKMPNFTGIKKYIKQSIFNSYDLAIASTELEKKVMINSYGIKKSSVVLAGAARNDVLVNDSNITMLDNTILLAPTWRVWLHNSDSLRSSDFFKNYEELLTDIKVNIYLKKHKIILKFYLHHMFHRYINEFKSFQNEYIHILEPDTDISKLIKNARLLITDYSSICSDFYYLKKPVLFYHFDQEKYTEKIGSEINLKSNNFGVVLNCKKDLIKAIVNIIDNDYVLSKKQINAEKYFINFTDNKNCQRIYSEINSLLKKRV